MKEHDEKIILKENILRFFKSANLVYKDKDFTSAAILYFKTLFAVLDLIIINDIGKSPKDHTERFRILESKYSELYAVLDKIFPVYRDTYTATISKDICDKVRSDVEQIIKEQGILKDN